MAASSPPRPGTPGADNDRPLDVAAIVIDKKISAFEAGRQVVKSSKQAIRESLKEHGVPSWVSDRVESFMTPIYPFVKLKRGSLGYHVQEHQPDDLSSLFQEFYEQLEHELRSSNHSPRRHESKLNAESENGELLQEMIFNESRIRETLELVESLMCTQLYDKLFRPDSTDDDQHDDALSSRIAALNMLDLSLETLGVDVGENGDALGKLIQLCGDGEYFAWKRVVSNQYMAALGHLESPSCQTPMSKAAVLVKVHRILVGR